MPLDLMVQAVLDQIAALNMPAWDTLTPEEVRALPRMNVGTPEDVARVDDRTIPGPAGEIPVRLYEPEGEAPFPVVVFFHGGGWVIGDIESHDMTCRALANAAGCVVVSVGYRLAPEHKFPAPLDDCYAAAQHVSQRASDFNADASRLAVGGDSAGGNLAAAVALVARDRGGPDIRFQLLVYPVTNYAFDTASYRDNATGYLLTTDSMKWFWDHYLRDESDGADPLASPLRASDLTRLPPALVITAEFDPLRDEGEAYAGRLRAAGVRVTATRYDGQIHGFFSMPGIFPASRKALDEAGAALRAALAAPATARR